MTLYIYIYIFAGAVADIRPSKYLFDFRIGCLAKADSTLLSTRLGRAKVVSGRRDMVLYFVKRCTLIFSSSMNYGDYALPIYENIQPASLLGWTWSR